VTADPGPVTVLIRPEQLEIVASEPGTGADPDCLAGRVIGCDYYGHDAVVRVRPDGQPAGDEVIVRTTGGPQLPAGAPVRVHARGPVIAWTSS
jgi:TOBE domain